MIEIQKDKIQKKAYFFSCIFFRKISIIFNTFVNIRNHPSL